MESRVAGVTVSVVLPDLPPKVAVIVVGPAATDVANPLVAVSLLMTAVAVSDELQVTTEVRSCVVLSEYIPVAVNCWVVPHAMLWFVGVTSMESRVAAVRDSVVLPDL